MQARLLCWEIGFKSTLVLEVSASDLHEVVFRVHHKESELTDGTISPELWKEQSLRPQNLELDFTEKLLTHAKQGASHVFSITLSL